MKREDFYIQEAMKYSQSEILKAESLAFIAGMKMADSYPNWIKVEDRLPEAKYRVNEKGYSDGVLILVREKFGFTLMDAIYDYETGEWYDRNDDVVCGNITHWMPIVLPKED